MRPKSVYVSLLTAACLAGCNTLTGADGLTTDETGAKLVDEPADAGSAARYKHPDAAGTVPDPGNSADASTADGAAPGSQGGLLHITRSRLAIQLIQV